jgi:4-amino-4-deoxy-L-arabinose transferase-like glycosyltransferase
MNARLTESHHKNMHRDGFVAILAFTCFLRCYGINSQPLNFDEVRNEAVARQAFRILWIDVLEEIDESESPIPFVLTPLSGYEHPPMSVYMIRLSAAIFGWNLFGIRVLHLVAAVATPLMVYGLAKNTCGHSVALLSMLLLCVNKFHIGLSRMALPQSPLFLMATLSLYVFWQAIHRKDGRLMVGAGVLTGLAYLAKEEAALLLPVFFLFVVLPDKHRNWLKRKELYLALLLMLLISSVDLFRLLQVKPDPDMNLPYYLEGILNTDISLCPVKFFLGELFPVDPDTLSEEYAILATGTIYREYLMHWVPGAICLAAVAYSIKDWKNDFVRLMLIAFGVVFVFFMFGFTLSELENGYWHAELCLFPAIILTARMLVAIKKKRERFGTVMISVLVVYLAFKAIEFVIFSLPF